MPSSSTTPRSRPSMPKPRWSTAAPATGSRPASTGSTVARRTRTTPDQPDDPAGVSLAIRNWKTTGLGSGEEGRAGGAHDQRQGQGREGVGAPRQGAEGVEVGWAVRGVVLLARAPERGGAGGDDPDQGVREVDTRPLRQGGQGRRLGADPVRRRRDRRPQGGLRHGLRALRPRGDQGLAPCRPDQRLGPAPSDPGGGSRAPAARHPGYRRSRLSPLSARRAPPRSGRTCRCTS